MHSDSNAAYLGVALGTSAVKLTLLGADGRVVADAEAAYDVDTSADGRAEIVPLRWRRALHDARAALTSRTEPTWECAAIGFAGQMHGVVRVDDADQAVGPAVLWADQRTRSVLPRWLDLPEDARAALLNPIVAGKAGPILTWLNEQPDPPGGGSLETAAPGSRGATFVPFLTGERGESPDPTTRRRGLG